MSTFNIEIDATQLFYRLFIVPGVTPDWISSRVVQPLALAAGTYHFQIASGYYADFTFRVTAAGTVDYNSSYDGFLKGRGTSRLVVEGLEVALDARYAGMSGGAGVLLVAPLTNEDWILQRTVRLVPASAYAVQQGSGLVSSFQFRLRGDGRFEYNPSYDIAAGGFLGGQGTSTLTFFGYPFLLDGTRAGGIGVHLAAVWGLRFAENSVQFANLLPMGAPYQLQVTSGVVTDASVLVRLDGTTQLNSGGVYLLSRDTFHGLARLTLTKA